MWRSLAARFVRDEEAAGSNPATPTEKFQVDGMIAKRGGHAIDHLLAIRWRDRPSVRGMRRGGSAENATAAGHRPSRVERVLGPQPGDPDMDICQSVRHLNKVMLVPYLPIRHPAISDATALSRR